MTRSVVARRLVAVALSALLVPLALFSPALSDPTFQTVTVGGPGYEPGVDVGPNGVVWVNAPTGLGSHSNLWRSVNDGSFVAVDFGNVCRRLFGGGDSDVAVSPIDGTVYFIDLWVGSNAFSRSSDGGATWTCTPLSTVEADRQWIEVGPRDPQTGLDTIYVFYRLFEPGNLMLSKSTDGGLTWTEHKMVPDGPPSTAASPGQVVVDGDFIAFTYQGAGRRQSVGFSSDGGGTWTTKVIDTSTRPSSGDIAGTALDPVTKNLYVTWADGQTYDIGVARAAARGQTWSTNMIVTPASNVYPWVGARGGKVAVAWYGSVDGIQKPDNVLPSTEWYVNYAETIDPDTDPNSDGWIDGFTTPVAISARVLRGPICTQGLGCTRSGGNRALGDFMQLTIDHQGRSLVVYGLNGSTTKLGRQIL